MPLTAQQVLDRLGRIVKGDRSQAEQARYMLPFVLLMRLDTKLKPTRAKLKQQLDGWDVQEVLNDTEEKGLDAQFARETTGQYFFNLGPYALEDTVDAQDALRRLEQLVRGFSSRVRRLLAQELGILQKAEALQKSQSLFRFLAELVDLQRETESLNDLGFSRLLSDLLQLLSEGTNDDASECATPQDVVDLMVALLTRLAYPKKRSHLTVYDPTYGTAGLLVHAAAAVRSVHRGADVRVAGHERRSEMHALGALATLLQVSTFNSQAPADVGEVGAVVEMLRGNSLKPEARAAGTADYAVCNPPQGSSGKWSDVRSSVEAEAKRQDSRFPGGTPDVEDSSLLFLQHILDRLNGHGRATLVLNGSPLFAGQVSKKGGNAQSIRTWLLEKDYLDAVISLPSNLHFNTDITTYIWVLDKDKPAERANRVILVDASGRPGKEGEAEKCFCTARTKNQNKKRYDLSAAGIGRILDFVRSFADHDEADADGEPIPIARVVSTADFRFRKVKVHRPLRLRIRITDARLAKLGAELGDAQKKTWAPMEQVLREHVGYQTLDAAQFQLQLREWMKQAGHKVPRKPIRDKAVTGLSERDPEAVPYRDGKKRLIADPELADDEHVPWDQTTEEYLAKEVRPFLPEADRELVWTEEPELPGAEIPFNRLFFHYRPPRPLSAIGREIRDLRAEIDQLLDELEADLA